MECFPWGVGVTEGFGGNLRSDEILHLKVESGNRRSDRAFARTLSHRERVWTTRNLAAILPRRRRITLFLHGRPPPDHRGTASEELQQSNSRGA